MDSRTHLEYALFQLTPTRTRCDLVIFAGKKNEKLASGLLEPFLLHLKHAKDQISKGGYSLHLRPTSSNATWFTKATMERFVRFVSTPEVLERFVTIEREITQIESSIQLNEQANGVAEAEDGETKLSVSSNVESNGGADATTKENSKVQLLRALETRKVVLRKEQAMAYARALVAGFDLDCLDDLISFSDAFGALRLREACINFLELCNKKSDDGIWMDEVAAMQAYMPPDLSYMGTSGILIPGDNNAMGQIDVSASDSTNGSLDTNQDNGMQKTAADQSTESKVQIPPWAQYMHNFQGGPFHQMPPYQGYYLPGMQLPNYPPHVAWPSSVEDPNLGHRSDGNHRRSGSKKKQDKSKRTTKSTSKESDTTDPSQSSSSSDSDDGENRRNSTEKSHRNKQGKKSSRTVVIRNINYITPKRNEDRGSTSEDDSSDGSSLQQKVDEALGTFGTHHKAARRKNKKRDSIKNDSYETDETSEQDGRKTVSKNDNGQKKGQDWDAFQNILMQGKDSRVDNVTASTEHYQELVGGNGLRPEKSSSFNPESEEVINYNGNAADSFVLNDKILGNDVRPDPLNFESGNNGRLLKRGGTEELILMQRVETSGMNYQDPSFVSAFESATIKNRREEDLVVNNQLNKFPKASNAGFSYDDSSIFAGEASHAAGNRKDVFVDDSFMFQTGPVSFPSNPEPRTDIFLQSDIAGLEPKVNDLQDNIEGIEVHAPDDLCVVLGRESVAEQAVASWNPEMDYMEENRVSETTEKHLDVEVSDANNDKKLASSKSTKTAVSRSVGGKGPNKVGKDSLASLGRSRSDYLSRSKTTPARKTTPKSKAEQEEENRKRMEQLAIQRQKRIAERSGVNGSPVASSRTNLRENKRDAVPGKTGKTLTKAPTDDSKKGDKPVFRSSTADRLSTARKADLSSPTSSKAGPKKATTSMQRKGGPQDRKLNQDKLAPPKKIDEVKESNGFSSVSEASGRDSLRAVEPEQAENTKENITPAIKELHIVPSTKKNETEVIPDGDDNNLIPSSNGLSLPDQKDHIGADTEANKLGVQEKKVTDISPMPTTEHSCDPLPSTNSNTKENGIGSRNVPSSPEVFADEIATPPLDDETNAETIHSRKKWDDGESSRKASKGFRKLLLFGRKS